MNYQDLKEWDRVRAEELELHLKSVEQLTDYVGTTLKQSEEYSQATLKYLESKANQYVLCGLPQKNFVEAETTVGMPFAYDYEDEENLIKRILTEELLPRLAQVQPRPELQVLRDKLGFENEELKDIVRVVQHRCMKLSDTYHKEKNEATFRCKLDLYARQQRFVVAALLQTEVQKKVGGLAASYLQAAIDYEVEKHTIIKEVLCCFYKLQLQLDPSKPDDTLKLAEIEDSRTVVTGKLYAPHQLMDAATYSQVRQCIFQGQAELPAFTIDELKTYLSCLTFTSFSSRSLILKEFELGCSHNGRTTTSLARLTIDGFLHVYEDIHHAKGLVYKSDIFCKLDRHVKLTDAGPTGLELAHRENIRCRHSNLPEDNKLELTFATEDSKVEFVELVRSMELPGSERIF